MHGVLGSSHGHVTGYAIGCLQIGVTRSLNDCMARPALLAMLYYRCFAAYNIMRIVACCACQSSTALEEAGRLAHSIRLINDLKLFWSIIIELNDVICEPLTWAKRVYRSAKPANHRRQFGARGLQVTLHADVETALVVELRGIDDGPGLPF